MFKPARTLNGVEHSKYEPPNEFEVKMQTAVKTLEEIMSKNNEIESQTMIINMASTNDQQLDIVTSGCIFGCLTSRSREHYAKFSKLLQQTGSINPSITLTPINFIILERFWSISDNVRQNLITLLTEMTNWRLTRIEIVLGNALRQFLDFGNMPSRYTLLLSALRVLKNNADFLFKSKESGFIIASTVTVCTHYLIEIKQCPPEVANDARRIIIQILEIIMTIYFEPFQAVFGRNVVLILTMLSRFPEIAAIWKQLTLSPANMGVLDLLRRPPEKWLDITTLPFTTTRKFEFLHHTSPELTRSQFRELYRNMIGINTEGSVKALCLRAFMNPNHPSDPNTIDVRAMNIANLLGSCKNTQNESYNFVEFQTCKLVFFFEWLGFDAFPPNLNLPMTIITSWKALFHICTTNGSLVSSLYEFLILLVQTLYPPLTPVFVKSVTRIIQILSKNFPVAAVLDSTKVEKPLRELFKETFPELAVFFRKSNNTEITTAPVSPIVEKAPQISVTSVIDPIEISSPKEPPSKPKKKLKKRPVPVITLDDGIQEKNVKKVEAGWDSSLGDTIEKHINPLSDDIKEELSKLESVIKDGNAGDGTVEIEDACGVVVRNRESLQANDELKDSIADCFLVIFKKFLMEKKFFVPKDDESWDVRETFKEPFYIIFKQLYTNDDPEIIFSILESMYSKCPIVGYLLLFYVVASKIQEESDLTKDEYILAYQEFCKSNNKEVAVELAEDMEACALDDYKLYRYLLPKIFEMFGKDAIGSEPLIRTICTHSDSSVILDLTSNTFFENLIIFRRETFSQLVIASLEWEEYEQVFFWDLVKGEGIAFEWIVPILPKLDFERHSRASYHALVMMRTYGEPNMVMLRPLISRQRGDMFVLNALKILVQDEGDCQKLTTTVNNLMKKSIEANDFFEGKKSGKQTTTKKVGRQSTTKETIPLQTILGHLDMLRKYCTAKPTGQTERALKEFTEILSEIKSNSACSELSREFAELFIAVEILSGPGGRNLRKNRQRSNFEADDKSPSKRRRIKDDSDESE
uniref:SOSS complex subunit A homolog n=1 Tax=Panagrolaimus superbus TaxID=310955 RepID=A0A914Y782_9BILA